MNDSPFSGLNLDRAFALCFSGYPERLSPLFKEIKRVGLEDCCDRVYTYSSPFNRVMMDSVPHVRKLELQPGHFNAAMGHYGIAKSALALGMDRILVMEDDCRFAKNLDIIRECVSKAPEKWDALTFDAFVWRGNSVSPWSQCPFWRSGAAVCYGKRMLERLVICVEAAIGKDKDIHPLRNYDAYFDSEFVGDDMLMYRAWPNIAIQCAPPGTVMTDVNAKYAALGIDVSKYADFNGVQK